MRRTLLVHPTDTPARQREAKKCVTCGELAWYIVRPQSPAFAAPEYGACQNAMHIGFAIAKAEGRHRTDARAV